MFRILHRAHHFKRGWRNESVSYLVLGDKLERCCARKLGKAVGNHGPPMVKRWKQHMEKTANPGPVSRRPDQVTGLGKVFERHFDTWQMAKQHAMGVARAFGQAGSSRGVNNQRGVF